MLMVLCCKCASLITSVHLAGAVPLDLIREWASLNLIGAADTQLVDMHDG